MLFKPMHTYISACTCVYIQVPVTLVPAVWRNGVNLTWASKARIHLHTFGEQQRTARPFIPQDHSVVDCSDLRDPMRGPGHYHIGSNDTLIALFHRHENVGGFLRLVLGYFAHCAATNTFEAHVWFKCKWGKHRSVCVAIMTWLLLTEGLGLVVAPPSNFDMENWSRYGCGHLRCAACDDLHSTRKMQCLPHLERLWDAMVNMDGTPMV
jgi:hypothetical protein